MSAAASFKQSAMEESFPSLRVLFLVPTDLASLERKGVTHLIREREEGGALDRCITMHPFGVRNFRTELSEKHSLIEFGLTDSRPGAPRILRWLRFAAYLVQTVRRIRRLIVAEQINLVRAQDPYYMGLIGWLATRFLPRTAFCISIHADYDKLHQLNGARGGAEILGSRRLAKRLETSLLRCADGVLPIRQTLADRAIKYGARQQSVYVIPHGIDLAPFISDPMPYPDPIHLPADRKIISFIGRLSKENYIGDVIEIASRLVKRGDVVFVLAGDGPEGNEIRSTLEKRGLAGSILMVGAIDRRGVAWLRRRSSVALVPMGGFSLIEACAAGIPVVAYDVEWHAELVVSGKTGKLVAEGDWQGVAAALEELLDNPGVASAMGGRARQLAMERHSLEAASAAKLWAYRQVVAAKWGDMTSEFFVATGEIVRRDRG